jgi:hypothetical protein
VAVHGPLRDAEGVRDLTIGEPLGHQRGHLAFATGQLLGGQHIRQPGLPAPSISPGSGGTTRRTFAVLQPSALVHAVIAPPCGLVGRIGTGSGYGLRTGPVQAPRRLWRGRLTLYEPRQTVPTGRDLTAGAEACREFEPLPIQRLRLARLSL